MIDVRDAIAENGIRNALLTSIAPTGNHSPLLRNVTRGSNRVFAYAYTPKGFAKRRQPHRRRQSLITLCKCGRDSEG